MKTTSGWTSLTALGLATLIVSASPARSECDRLRECELVWSDEFDGSEVDETKWEFMLGTGTDYGLPAGWGNNEEQHYQAANASVTDGFLTITAREETVGTSSYTSARLRTMGIGEWTYGRFEMRAKMPIGQGLWPAFWMLPTDTRYGGWAASGEIDIMEYLGHEPDRVHGTIHYGAAWPNNSFTGNSYDLPSGSLHARFHVYAVEWERGEIRWYLNDVLYATQTEWFSTNGAYPAPFDVDFHLLLNLAVGGNWPGSPDSTTSFPQELVVDYVRVYQSASAKGTQATTTDILHEKATRMRKIRARLAMPFENQSRKSDRVDDDRRLSCRVTTEGRKGALKVKGAVALSLEGIRAGSRWTGRAIEAKVEDGGVVFESVEIGSLVDEALGSGAALERFAVVYSGAGGKKVTHTAVDCWQRPG